MNQTLMNYGGDQALSALGIMMSIITLAFMPILGISQGAQPLIGFNYGARQFARVKETLKKALLAASGVSFAAYLVIQIWPAQLAGMFTQDVALIELTASAMRVYFALIFIIGFQIVSSNYFQAVGKAKQATILSLSRQVLLFIPLLLILPRFWGIEGAWRTAPIADALSVILTGTFIYAEMKTLPSSQPATDSDWPTVEATEG